MHPSCWIIRIQCQQLTCSLFHLSKATQPVKGNDFATQSLDIVWNNVKDLVEGIDGWFVPLQRHQGPGLTLPSKGNLRGECESTVEGIDGVFAASQEN